MTRARTLWEEGHQPGRHVVALGAACLLTVVALDLATGGDLGLVFDLGFVALCVALALAVRPRDFFTVGVLPPLLMLAVFLLLSISAPGRIAAADDNPVQAVVTALATHAGALIVGYAASLGVLAIRHRVLAARATPPRESAPAAR